MVSTHQRTILSPYLGVGDASIAHNCQNKILGVRVPPPHQKSPKGNPEKCSGNVPITYKQDRNAKASEIGTWRHKCFLQAY